MALFNSRVLGFPSRREGTRLPQHPLPMAQSRSPLPASRHSSFQKACSVRGRVSVVTLASRDPRMFDLERDLC